MAAQLIAKNQKQKSVKLAILHVIIVISVQNPEQHLMSI